MTGFVNYTYQVNTTGHFNESNIYNSGQLQTIFNTSTENLYQNRPIPAPFARANLNFLTPTEFGPEIIGNHILGAWMLNIVLDWQDGYWTTWKTADVPNIAYNVQAVDYFNAYLRLQKTLTFGRLNFQLFMDVNNVFNTLRLWGTNNVDYMNSLHLPTSPAYNNIPGNDKVGDYRKSGVAWQPIEQQIIDMNSSAPSSSQMSNGSSVAMYYNSTNGKYWWFGLHGYSTNPSDRNYDPNAAATWWQVPQSKINQVVADKAYIQMPKESTFWFLDPRTFYFGLTFSFNLSD